MKKILVIAIAGAFFFGCSDAQVKEDLRVIKEDLAKTKEDLAKLRDDHEKLLKDATKAEVAKEDALEGSKMD
jgi:hypothetical protein